MLIVSGGESISIQSRTILKQGNHLIPKNCSKSDGVKMRSVLDVPDTHIFEKKRQYYLNRVWLL